MEIRNIYGDVLLIVDAINLRGTDLRDANLRGANLCGTDLRDANLRGANLCGANLCDANLRGANLCGANLRGTDLRDADLRGANLCGANLCDANLRGANLCGTDLRGANLCGANLCGANLCGANLCGTDLRDADLRGANLCDANLRGANLCGAKNFLPQLYILKQLPSKTKITLWKYLENGKSPFANTPILYIVGKVYRETFFDSDERETCGAGLSLATLQWCLNNSNNISGISFIECQFTPADIVAIPFATDGKIRVKKLKVLREVNREEAEKILKESMG